MFFSERKVVSWHSESIKTIACFKSSHDRRVVSNVSQDPTRSIDWTYKTEPLLVLFKKPDKLCYSQVNTTLFLSLQNLMVYLPFNDENYPLIVAIHL